ncbi:WAT1-related protein At5g40240 isoform X2 [Cajanus cajan]|uniref:WAT1-related protein n=1 Tax=Cajanus cajan TaxID=3821 RepID=A0A151TGL1_CAJCA|nr:WAT1-related protein At5g40240 isoform X2 [Cajanus cajan]KYP66194.1 Auxin-induced protein 5NG4 [Cajanus cajan]
MARWMYGTDNYSLPCDGMVMAMLAHSVSMLLIKVAITNGINKYVMVAYSYSLSTIMLLPFLFFLHRSKRPSLTLSALCAFFLLSLFGSSGDMMTYAGIELSSPTLASAMLSLVPAFTFVLALIFRMEEVHWTHYSSQAKVLGTIVSIAGAFVMILYKGPTIFAIVSDSSNKLQFSPQLNWVVGGIFCVGSSLVSSMWYIYQASVAKKYSSVTVIVFFQLLFSTILSVVIALIKVSDPTEWKLKLDMGLIAILYQAIGATLIRYTLCTWCVHRTGPLFCAMFKPLGIIFTVCMGAIFLGDDFNLGSVIGSAIISVGFYALVWGKYKEESNIENLGSSSHNAPLLQYVA